MREDLIEVMGVLGRRIDATMLVEEVELELLMAIEGLMDQIKDVEAVIDGRITYESYRQQWHPNEIEAETPAEFFEGSFRLHDLAFDPALRLVRP